MHHPAWTVVVVGVLIVDRAGLALCTVVPLAGQTPGDIAIERENFNFYSPLTTCILLSLADGNHVAGAVFSR